MFTQIRLRNFESFDDEAVDLRRINVFLGPNGAGKSSILQVLLLWAQSVDEVQLNTSGRLVDLGDQYDIPLNASQVASIGFGGEVSIPLPIIGSGDEDSIRLECDYSVYGTAGGRFRLVSGPLQLDAAQAARSEDPAVDLTGFEFEGATIGLGGHRRLPALFRLTALSGAVDELSTRQDINAIHDGPKTLLESIRFVPAIRGFQSSRYGLASSASGDLAREGTAEDSSLALAASLSYNDGLRQEVSELMKQVTKVGIDRTLDEGPRTAMVSTRNVRGGTKLVVSTNEGFGTNQLVYLLTQLLLTPYGGPTLVEEPETHLHPGAQARLGGVLATHALQSGTQLLLTTHSQDLLGGILWEVREGKLDPSDVAIFYVAQNTEGISTVHRKDVTHGGLVQGSYEEFFAGPEGYPGARSFFPGVTE